MIHHCIIFLLLWKIPITISRWQSLMRSLSSLVFPLPAPVTLSFVIDMYCRQLEANSSNVVRSFTCQWMIIYNSIVWERIRRCKTVYQDDVHGAFLQHIYATYTVLSSLNMAINSKIQFNQKCSQQGVGQADVHCLRVVYRPVVLNKWITSARGSSSSSSCWISWMSSSWLNVGNNIQ